MGLIDKEKIKQQCMIDLSSLLTAKEQGWLSEHGKGRLEALEGIMDFIEYVQEEPVSEMDLEKEVRKFIKDNCTSVEKPDEFLTTVMQLDDMKIFAKHFYELGLKARE